MSVRAFTSLKPARSADAGRIETLFARQREATERYRARFTLKDRLDSLSRLKETIKRREDDIVRALDEDTSMLSWFTVITLMVEAARVIEMRLRLIALGRGTADEMFLMVTEKVKALEEAGAIILRGGNPSLVIDNYQKIVAANVARLSGV